MAVATKPKGLSPVKLREIKARLKDLRQTHGEDIDRNTNLRFGAGIFAEMELLVKEVDRLQGGAAPEPDDEPAAE